MKISFGCIPAVLLRAVLLLPIAAMAADDHGPLSAAAAPLATNQYLVTNLTTNAKTGAPFTDPNLVNPWGVSRGSGGPWWISDNGTGLATLYTGTGSIVPLVVTIPPAKPGSGNLGTPTRATTSSSCFETGADFWMRVPRAHSAPSSLGARFLHKAPAPRPIFPHSGRSPVRRISEPSILTRVAPSRILNQRVGISANMGLRISAAFGTEPGLSLRLPAQRDFVGGVQEETP